MRKLVWGLVVLAGLAAVVFVLARSAAKPLPDQPSKVEVRAVRRDDRSVVKATGIIKPRVGAEVRVGSRVSGVVKRLYVQIGDSVRKGQLLAELDARELAARRTEAAAALALSDANLKYAMADLQRKRELAAAQLVPPSDLDLAERACTVAEQQRAQAEANLDTAATQLGYSRIHAPISGVVASVATQEGETVAASLAAPTFVTLLDLERLEVLAYVDETDIGRIRLGQKARFTVDTYPDQELEGRVEAIYPQAAIRDNVVNYVTVVRFAPSRGQVLRPEMTAMVKISTGKAKP